MSDEDLNTFVSFPKIARASSGVVITEKIDGTNAQICITPEGKILTGSRNRWITPDDDNFGFARWVASLDPAEVLKLGIGRHYGEWYGSGIQRTYGLTEKRFALFQSDRWSDEKGVRPSFAGVVPILYRGEHTDDAVKACMQRLRDSGSVAVPGFTDPEGVVLFNFATGTYKKVTFAEPKWQALARASAS